MGQTAPTKARVDVHHVIPWRQNRAKQVRRKDLFCLFDLVHWSFHTPGSNSSKNDRTISWVLWAQLKQWFSWASPASWWQGKGLLNFYYQMSLLINLHRQIDSKQIDTQTSINFISGECLSN